MESSVVMVPTSSSGGDDNASTGTGTQKDTHAKPFDPSCLLSSLESSNDVRENSNMIQVTSSTSTMWRGELWSKILFKIKLHDYFLSQKKNHASGFLVSAFVVNVATGETISSDAPDKVTLAFESESLEGDASMAAVKSDPYNKLKVTIHQDAFTDGEAFFVKVGCCRRDRSVDVSSGAKRKEEDVIIVGRSEAITVTNHALVIDECFDQNKYVQRIDGVSKFGWYSKRGGDKCGLEVKIHVKDAKGNLVRSFPHPLQLKTELVYDDGVTPTPHMPIAPLKSKGAVSKLPLYRPLREEPVIPAYEGTAHFSFRIEEVSVHHLGHDGFKLKVSPATTSNSHVPVHPACLRETIVVLSKPKNEGRFKTREKKKARDNGQVLAVSAPNTKRIRLVSTEEAMSKTLDPIAVVRSEVLFNSYVTEDGQWGCCNSVGVVTKFFSSKHHRNNCRFASCVLPSIDFATITDETCASSSTNRAPDQSLVVSKHSKKKSNFVSSQLSVGKLSARQPRFSPFRQLESDPVLTAKPKSHQVNRNTKNTELAQVGVSGRSSNMKSNCVWHSAPTPIRSNTSKKRMATVSISSSKADAGGEQSLASSTSSLTASSDPGKTTDPSKSGWCLECAEFMPSPSDLSLADSLQSSLDEDCSWWDGGADTVKNTASV